MPTTGPVQEMQKQRRKQKAEAKKKLENFVLNKISLQRPVFFVPGWTDETNVCWKTAYKNGYTPIKEWISKIYGNHHLAHYITFSNKESKKCRSFLDFAVILKTRIWSQIGGKTKFDIVAHSMGGLDADAAITDDNNPLENVHNFITVATPHLGSELGELGPKFKKYQPHHAIQCVNLDPDQLPIKFINTLEKRKILLNRIHKLYCLMGTQDMAVMRSARYNKNGLNSDLYKKMIEIVEFEGAGHSQKFGITQDPRAILAIINILTGVKLTKTDSNYGYIFKKA